MNANQLINMVIRMVTRRLLRTGMNAGMDAVGKRINKGKSPDGQGQNVDSAETTKRAKQTMRAARRIGRL